MTRLRVIPSTDNGPMVPDTESSPVLMEIPMFKSATRTLNTPQERVLDAFRQIALVVGATFFVALCAHITIPLMPLTPVPLTVQNFAVLLVGLLLGSRRGFAALTLYLA